MSGSKHFDKIVWSLTAIMLVMTILFMNGGALGIEVMARTMGYENRLFDNTHVHTIDIVMDNWDGFIANATTEEYYTAALVIDGESYKNIAIRGKGNTSLSTVSSLGSERYSFKVEFDHYDSSVTYHGLDKLSLNNLIQDATMMKDYLTYTMMDELGANAPLCSFAYLTVNGEDWGLYLAVEGVEDSFLERNYGSDYGELYKPDSMNFGGGRGNGKNFNMDDFIGEGSGIFEFSNGDFSGGFDFSSFPEDFDMSKIAGASGNNFGGNVGGFGGGMSSSDVKLQYIDDNLDSYSNIWNGAKTDITEADQHRLVESLKKLSNSEDITSVVDVEALIKYFVVHNYVCNGDSYTGSMIHNYYLYEENGKLSMLPWDYNLAFGTFQGGDAQSTVNTPIDSPVSGGSMEDRPMIAWIFDSEEYTELYHAYFKELLENVDTQGIINGAYELIAPYVQKDPTAFYSYEEFEKGVQTLREFCTLRSESVAMQLQNGETTEDMGYVDASTLTLSDMGSMSMDPGRGGFGGMPDMQGGFGGEMPEGFANGEISEGFGSAQMPEDFGGEAPAGFGGMMGEMPAHTDGASAETSDARQSQQGARADDSSQRPSRDNMQIPSGGSFGASAAQGNNTAWIWLAVSAIVLCVGLIVAKIYRY